MSSPTTWYPGQPADALRAAADRLDQLIAEAVVDGPWEFRHDTDPDFFPWQVYAPKAKHTAGTGFCAGTARYIAAMDPVLGRALVVAIRSWAAAAADEGAHGTNVEVVFAEELNVARALLDGVA